MTYVFDNNWTFLYASVISVWALVFLEFWKRRNEVLRYQWDLQKPQTTEDPIRSAYRRQAEKYGSYEYNPEVGAREPVVDINLTRMRRCCSFVTVLFSVLLIVAALFGTILYRAVLRRAYANHELVQKISDNIEYVRIGI